MKGSVSHGDRVRQEMAERLQRAESAAISARREGWCAGFEAGKAGRLVCLLLGSLSGALSVGFVWWLVA